MSRHLKFLIAVLIVVTLGLVAPLMVVSHRSYCRHSEVYWDATDCFKFDVKDQASEVVFVGDSAALYGVRPRVLQERLGVTGVNLGLQAGTMIYLPTLLLDRYLAQNRPPRLIVLFLSPWSGISPKNIAAEDLDQLWIDSARVALRHASLPQALAIFGTDLRRVLRFDALFAANGWAQFSSVWWQQASQEMTDERGWMAYWRPGRLQTVGTRGWLYFNTNRAMQPPATLTDGCVLSSKPVKPSREDIDAFRRKYRELGIPVLFYVAPVPSCDPSYPQVVKAFAGVADNVPDTIPGRYVVADGWRTHVTREGADLITERIARFIGPFLSGGFPESVAASTAPRKSAP